MNLIARILSLFRRSKLDRDMRTEMTTHLDEQTRRNLAAGMSPDEARAAAHRQFGGVAQIQERAREARATVCLEQLLQDVRYALRALRKRPGFAITAVLLLALGVGANAAVFSLIDRLLLAALPVRAPEQLVTVERHNPTQAGTATFSYAFFQELRDESQLFAGVLSRARGAERVTVGTDTGGEAARGELVSGNFFEVLGVQPAVGRLFTSADDVTPGAHPIVVLSHRFWQRRFGADPAIVGQTIHLTGLPMTVVGVTPANFQGLDASDDIDLRVPLAMQSEIRGGVRSNPERRPTTEVLLLARLPDGRSLAQMESVVAARWRAYQERQPAPSGQTAQAREAERIVLRSAVTGVGQMRQKFQPTLRILIATTGAILLVACLNLASLFLAQAAGRQPEFSLRLALGASVGRITRQLLVETLLLGILGAALAAVLAAPGAALLWRIMSDGSSTTPGPGMVNPTLVLGLISAALLCASLVALAPVWRLRRLALASGLKADRRTTRAGGRQWLVCAQVAVSVVVLTGAGMFVRTVHALRAADPGFDAGHLLLMALSPKNAGRSDAESQSFFRDVRERVKALPGVEGATYAMIRALTGNAWPAPVVIEGGAPALDLPQPTRNVVGPEYFGTFGITLVVGRDFTAGDDANAPKVAIVNQRLAELYFPGQEALGRKIGAPLAEYTIIGVARDIRQSHLRDAPPPVWYIPCDQFPATKYLDLCVRTTGDPEAMLASVRSAIAAVDRGVAQFDVRTQQSQLEQLFVNERTLATLATCFGVIAAALAAVGLHGLLAFLVTQQRREIGIRMALGARSGTVVRAILRHSLRLALGGIVPGLILAYVLTRSVNHLLFGVAPGDPVVLVSVALGLVLISLVACWLPARRAAKLDPIVALRAE